MQHTERSSGLLAPRRGLVYAPAGGGRYTHQQAAGVTFGQVQKKSAVAASATSVAATFTSTPVAGNYLIAFVQHFASSRTWTPPAGWSTPTFGEADNSDADIAMFYKAAAGTESGAQTFSLSGAATALRVIMYEYSGIASYDKSTFGSQGFGVTSSSTGTTGTLGSSNPFLIGGCVIRNSTSGHAVNNSFSILDTLGTVDFVTFARSPGANTATSCTTSWTGSADAISVVSSFLRSV